MKKVLALLTLLASVAVVGIAASPANPVKFGEPDVANARDRPRASGAASDAQSPAKH